MTADVYGKLRQVLDQTSAGYPATESGVELKILEKLFAPDEAELFIRMGPAPQTPAETSVTTGLDQAQCRTRLETMFFKGLVFRYLKDGRTRYMTAPFIEGIYEYQVKTMDRELAALFEQYGREALFKSVIEAEPLLVHRPIAVNRAIDISQPVPTYENSRQLVQDQSLVAVTDCICRVQKGLIDEGCDKPRETCFMFGPAARHFLDRGMARQVSVEEALNMLEAFEQAGLVSMPLNAQAPANLCNCCSDCCLVLANLKKYPCPAEMMNSYHQAEVDPARCEGCEVCLERCPMEAIVLSGTAVEAIDHQRCIGCGLCVSACPSGALRLEPRPEAARLQPPRTARDFYAALAHKRGLA